MSNEGRTIITGFVANLFVNALMWAAVVIGISAISPNFNQMYVLAGLAFGSLLGVFITTGVKRDTPLRPYRFAKFMAWLVMALVWGLMAATIKGPIPNLMIYWSSGIMVLLSIVGVVFCVAILPNRRTY